MRSVFENLIFFVSVVLVIITKIYLTLYILICLNALKIITFLHPFPFATLGFRDGGAFDSRSGSLLKLLGCFQQLPLQGLHMFIPVVGAC